MIRIRSVLIWMALLSVIAVPIVAAFLSPLHAWRDWIYISAGFSGILAMCLLLMQPLLISGVLPGFYGRLARRAHFGIGLTMGLAVILHVVGLWITSPPDVIDALLFRSPTPFSHWGVSAMWALFAAALLAVYRRRLPFSPSRWKLLHGILASFTVVGTIMHAFLIEGAMEPISKWGLGLAVIAASLFALAKLAKALRRR